MIVQCDKCRTKFRIADAKVTESGVKVRCSRCAHVFMVRRSAEATAPPQAAPGSPHVELGDVPSLSAALADELREAGLAVAVQPSVGSAIPSIPGGPTLPTAQMPMPSFPSPTATTKDAMRALGFEPSPPAPLPPVPDLASSLGFRDDVNFDDDPTAAYPNGIPPSPASGARGLQYPRQPAPQTPGFGSAAGSSPFGSPKSPLPGPGPMAGPAGPWSNSPAAGSTPFGSAAGSSPFGSPKSPLPGPGPMAGGPGSSAFGSAAGSAPFGSPKSPLPGPGPMAGSTPGTSAFGSAAGSAPFGSPKSPLPGPGPMAGSPFGSAAFGAVPGSGPLGVGGGAGIDAGVMRPSGSRNIDFDDDPALTNPFFPPPEGLPISGNQPAQNGERPVPLSDAALADIPGLFPGSSHSAEDPFAGLDLGTGQKYQGGDLSQETHSERSSLGGAMLQNVGRIDLGRAAVPQSFEHNDALTRVTRALPSAANELATTDVGAQARPESRWPTYVGLAIGLVVTVLAVLGPAGGDLSKFGPNDIVTLFSPSAEPVVASVEEVVSKKAHVTTYTTRNGKRLLVVAGYALNTGKQELSDLEVVALVRNGRDLVEKRDAKLGLMIDEEALSSIATAAELDSIVSARAKSMETAGLKPGAMIPFMVVFPDPPDDLSHRSFHVEFRRGIQASKP